MHKDSISQSCIIFMLAGLPKTASIFTQTFYNVQLFQALKVQQFGSLELPLPVNKFYESWKLFSFQIFLLLWTVSSFVVQFAIGWLPVQVYIIVSLQIDSTRLNCGMVCQSFSQLYFVPSFILAGNCWSHTIRFYYCEILYSSLGTCYFSYSGYD